MIGDGTDPGTAHPGWRTRFLAAHPVAFRPARGQHDLALVVEQRATGIGAFVWNGRTGERLDVPKSDVAWGATLTPDGSHLVQLDDPGGTEIGHLHAIPVDGGAARDLTPGFDRYVVRGLDIAPDGRTAIATLVDGSGFTLWLLDLAGCGGAVAPVHVADRGLVRDPVRGRGARGDRHDRPQPRDPAVCGHRGGRRVRRGGGDADRRSTRTRAPRPVLWTGG